MARPERTRSRSWLAGALAMAGWLVMGAFSLASTAQAQTCGQISIEHAAVSADDVTPGAGTTATTFTFSVLVSDRTGAKPRSVVVRVAGAFKPMTTTDKDVRAGLVYRLGTKLPAGSYSYWFRATSSRGITCDLTLVSPATITITAPTPTPRPTPTPTPTPKPTPKPTPTPTPRPTPKPTKATPKPTPMPSAPTRPMPDASQTASPTDATAASATPAASASAPTASSVATVAPSSTPSQSGTQVPVIEAGGSTDGGSSGGGSTDGGSAGAAPGSLGGSGSTLVGPVFIWLVTSAGGIGLFLFLTRRSDDDAGEGLLLAPAGGGAGVAATAASPLPPIESSAPRVTGRATMLPPIDPRTFDQPPAKGVERATIGYRRVRISNKPDAVRSVERGRLERGDEVEILDSYEGYLEIRTPDGLTGWILRHTIVG